MILMLAMWLQFSGSGTFVPGQGGLNGWQQNAPTISATSASCDATSCVLQWTTSIGSDSRGHCGSEEAVDDGVQSGVTAHQVVVAGLTPSTVYTCTVQSGSTTQTVSGTTTALATSTPITAVSFGSSTQYNSTSPPHAMNGDTFYNFTSNDGITYLTTDDTVGYNGTGVTSALLLAKFTNLSPLVAADVNPFSGIGVRNGPQYLSGKDNGLLSIAGSLVLSLTYQNQTVSTVSLPQYFGSLMVSNNHGVSWNNMQAPGTFTTTGTVMTPLSTSLWPGTTPTSFASSTFVIYGADDGTLGYLVSANRVDNGNAYIYGISNNIGGSNAMWANGDSYYLWRVPRAKILNLHASDYQFYVSGDGTLDAHWSSNQGSAGAILTNSGKSSIANIQYIPALNRYLLLTYYYPSGVGTPSSSVWLAYESPHPWGTWTQIGTFTFATTGDYNPIVLQTDALSATLPTVTMRVLWTQNFTGPNYNMFIATMTVSH